MFVKATKEQLKLRLALVGPSGSGKTMTALRIGTALLDEGQRLAYVDTEHGSAKKYADRFDFDVIEPATFHPDDVAKYIRGAEASGHGVLVIDSLTHFWNAEQGALEQVDRVARSKTHGNSFAAWKEVTPMMRGMVSAILAAKVHVIACMRVKTEWVIEKDEKTGKSVPRKVGLQPEQRAGLEYEFDVVADLDAATMTVSKTRCPELDERVFRKPGEDVANILRAWLGSGVAPAESPEPDAYAVNMDELVMGYETATSEESIAAADLRAAGVKDLLTAEQRATLLRARKIGKQAAINAEVLGA